MDLKPWDDFHSWDFACIVDSEEMQGCGASQRTFWHSVSIRKLIHEAFVIWQECTQLDKSMDGTQAC